jgi:hypothetical protein
MAKINLVFYLSSVTRTVDSGNMEGASTGVDDVVELQRKQQHEGHGRCAVTKSLNDEWRQRRASSYNGVKR